MECGENMADSQIWLPEPNLHKRKEWSTLLGFIIEDPVAMEINKSSQTWKAVASWETIAAKTLAKARNA